MRLDLKQVLDQIESSGRRVTAQRRAVCEALLAHGGHPTTTEIWRRVHAVHPSISQATVYNTIATLEELRLIQKLDIAGDEHAHYDLDVAPHVNVVCTRCGRIADVYTDTLEALLGLVAARAGYCLDPQEGVIVYGLCAECRRMTNDDRRPT
ncbi:MAG TPA: transcriptional repressor [Roseiflexaceae bacterium]|jgi:Fur family peroxide stress response transcriptional regulator